MANRIRTNRNEFHLDDKEQYILDEKFKLSGMKSKSAFLRKLILYGYVYDVDYSFLREYNTELGRISSSLNQIAKRINSTNHVYQEDMDEVKELMKQVWHTQKSMSISIRVRWSLSVFPLRNCQNPGSQSRIILRRRGLISAIRAASSPAAFTGACLTLT